MQQIIPLTYEENKSYKKQKVWYICKERDHCDYTGKYEGAAHNICNLRHKIPKEIPVVFHNSSRYNCHFIINEL